MVQLGVLDNPKEHLDKQPIIGAEAPNTVVVIPSAPPRAKSTCCTKRVKITVTVVCFIGTLAILGALLGFHLYRRHRAGCRTSDEKHRDGDRDGWWDGDRDDGHSPDGRHGEDDRDGDSEERGRGRGPHGGPHDGPHNGPHDGPHGGPHDDPHGGHDGGHDGGHGGDHREGGTPPPAPPPQPQ